MQTKIHPGARWAGAEDNRNVSHISVNKLWVQADVIKSDLIKPKWTSSADEALGGMAPKWQNEEANSVWT